MAALCFQVKGNNLECWTVKGLSSKMHVPRGLVWEDDLLLSSKSSILKVVDKPVVYISNAMKKKIS